MPSCACFCTQPVPLLEGKQFCILRSIAAYNRAWGAGGALLENTSVLIAFSFPRQPTQPSVFTFKLAFHSNQLGRNRARRDGPARGAHSSGMDIPTPGSTVLKEHVTKAPTVIFKGEFPYTLPPTHSKQRHPNSVTSEPLPRLAHLCLYHPWF